MLNLETIRSFTDHCVKDMEFRLIRPLSDRFKPNMVYTLPNLTDRVQLKVINPLNLPELIFSDIQIQFEYDAITPALKFLAENRNIFSVSLPTNMRFNLLNETLSHEQINIVNGTLDIAIAEIAYKDTDTQKEIQQDFNVNFMFSFTTQHDNLTYVANIDSADFLNQIMIACANKEFQG